MTAKNTAVLALVLTFAAAAAGQTASGDDPGLPPDTTARTLTLRPAAESRPALRYTLLPHVLDQTEGNAAAAYKALIETWEARADHEAMEDQVAGWLKQPVGALPVERVRRVLAAYPLAGLRDAARMEHCDWELPIRTEGINLMLPSLGSMRQFARAIALQARLQIHAGDFTGAIDSLQTGFAMADHVGRPYVLISGIVAIAITQQMLDVVETWIETPGSPNLYWALAALPRPFMALDRSMQVERSILLVSLPSLRKFLYSEMTPDEWAATAGALRQELGELLDVMENVSSRGAPSGENLAPMALALKYYSPAKAWLVREGYAPEAIERMPVLYVTLRYLVGDFLYWSGETQKWFHVPFWQGYPRIQRADEAFMDAVRDGDVGILTRVFMPYMGKAYAIMAEMDRHIAALECIEALRMQAAADGGTWPRSLEAVVVVPLPINPMTGRPFEFRRGDDGAVLVAAALEGMEGRFWTRYDLAFGQSPK
ncbi:MAG: hypothetical protein GX591_18470 [Planctomycetes bacterium]|nr:hypothetical protein [Planctomycetota bacterium]